MVITISGAGSPHGLWVGSVNRAKLNRSKKKKLKKKEKLEKKKSEMIRAPTPIFKSNAEKNFKLQEIEKKINKTSRNLIKPRNTTPERLIKTYEKQLEKLKQEEKFIKKNYKIEENVDEDLLKNNKRLYKLKIEVGNMETKRNHRYLTIKKEIDEIEEKYPGI